MITANAMTDSETRATLRAFVQENFLYMRPDLRFGDDDSLLAQGIIDSLGVMELVGFVEERWQVTVDASAVTEQHFGSIAAVARFVTTLQRGAA